MSVFLFGFSHRSAPVPVLERLAVDEHDRNKVVDKLLETGQLSEVMLVSTCNRMEIYAVVDAFHPALEAVARVVGDHSGMPVNEMTRYAYVRYSEAAVEHLFNVAAGLDSLVVGEQQILGQIRSAYASADANSSVGRVLHELAQQSLRVGKRVHAETGIDRAGASVVSVALEKAASVLGERLEHAVVLGAGAMGGLAAAHLARAGTGEITLVNRTVATAENLARNVTAKYGVVASVATIDELSQVMSQADLVVTCTGAVSSVVTVAELADALDSRTSAHPLVICDLGLPRNVDPAAAQLSDLTLIDIESLRGDAGTHVAASEARAARRIVADELASYLASQRQAEVTPTVTALRARAAEVVAAEILRLESRLPDLDAAERREVAKTVQRVVDKLLHAPTVRVKQLASAPGGDHYAEALRELFELEPGAAESVSISDVMRNGEARDSREH